MNTNSEDRELKPDELDGVTGAGVYLGIPRPPIGPAFPSPSPTGGGGGGGGGGGYGDPHHQN
jgi:hypothetical protein